MERKEIKGMKYAVRIWEEVHYDFEVEASSPTEAHEIVDNLDILEIKKQVREENENYTNTIPQLISYDFWAKHQDFEILDEKGEDVTGQYYQEEEEERGG